MPTAWNTYSREMNPDTTNAEWRETLRKQFARFRSERLKGISVADFKASLYARLGVVDWAGEGFHEAEQHAQRDMSVKFHWGHDHDFGDFQIAGRMKQRHIEVMADFLELFSLPLDSFADKQVLDVGCWTGGTSLLLAALDARVHAVDEVQKYAETVRFLADSFGLADRLSVAGKSVYSCRGEHYEQRFDIAYFPGVIYHLSDPLLALRVLYNALIDGGSLLIESKGIDHPEPLCRFEGSQVHGIGEERLRNRGGWNWFVPSASALERLLLEAGFVDVSVIWHTARGRLYARALKSHSVAICRAGLSDPTIP